MNKVGILLVRRLIKIVANLLKVGCYGFHGVFPKKRFLIPGHAAPLLSGKARSGKAVGIIPKTIWQTNFTNRVTLPVYINYLFNRLMAPTYEHRFMVTAERAEFIQAHYSPEIFNTYSRIQIGAAQADFWRVLALQKHGGVYMDIDAHLIWPLERILPPEQEELYIQIKTQELSNYFIASKPNNPNLEKVIVQIQENIATGNSKNTYEITGPGVFTKLLRPLNVPTRYYLYTCNQGNFTNEYFQYIDKPQGKWTKEQQKTDVIRKEP